MILVIGISGASGAIYGIRALEVLRKIDTVVTHAIITEHAEDTIKHETDYSVSDVKALADFSHDIKDVGASLASGSFKRDGMIVAPCTVKTMSALAYSHADNLMIRAADVTLKERKPLVLVLRETPLHLGHIRNMERLTEMGAIILPPVPSFYSKPDTIDDIVNGTVGKILDLLNVEHSLSPRWTGLTTH